MKGAGNGEIRVDLAGVVDNCDEGEGEEQEWDEGLGAGRYAQ